MVHAHYSLTCAIRKKMKCIYGTWILELRQWSVLNEIELMCFDGTNAPEKKRLFRLSIRLEEAVGFEEKILHCHPHLYLLGKATLWPIKKHRDAEQERR